MCSECRLNIALAASVSTEDADSSGVNVNPTCCGGNAGMAIAGSCHISGRLGCIGCNVGVGCCFFHCPCKEYIACPSGSCDGGYGRCDSCDGGYGRDRRDDHGHCDVTNNLFMDKNK